MFSLFKERQENKRRAKLLYRSILEQARQPVFYEAYGVPDTVTGRFELVVLHNFLVWKRLEKEKDVGRVLSQALFDVMFRDLSYALRNIGVGDLAVPHHMRRMMRGYKGRVLAYDAAITVVEEDNGETLRQALRKNLFATVKAPSDDHLTFFTAYIQRNINFLNRQESAECLRGDISWSLEELTTNEERKKQQAFDTRVVA